ncbi:MAG: hypothetical protein CM1200mP18_01690 [Gammaproteobacteria bacterium]|nr:MAG: hypothetical protein CM1200mP18_01690 [Gammaproteobacteria bacterium]
MAKCPLSTERVYVERPIFDRFPEELRKCAPKPFVRGDPFTQETSLGPLISHNHRNKVLSYYRRATELGANVIVGGGAPDMPEPGGKRLLD